MTIAFHIGEDIFKRFGFNFNLECALQLAHNFPQHHFIVIYDRQPEHIAEERKNVKVIISGPVVKNRISHFYWYNLKLPVILKKHAVDVFIPSENNFCLKCDCRQVYISSGKAEKSEYKIRRQAISKFTYPPLSDHQTQFIPIPAGLKKMDLSYEKKLQLKEKYTGGEEFFFAIVSNEEQNSVRLLLKAFSHFKKWQRSSLKLLICTDTDDGIPDFHLYKFKNDVKFIKHDPNNHSLLYELLSACYASIVYDKASLMASSACGTAAIYLNSDKEQNDQFYVSAFPDEKNISKQMILLYKDEVLRNQVILNAQEAAKTFNWEYTSAVLWNAITLQ